MKLEKTQKLNKKFAASTLGWQLVTDLTDTSFKIDDLLEVEYTDTISNIPVLAHLPNGGYRKHHDIEFKVMIDGIAYVGRTDTEALEVPNSYRATLVCNELFKRLVTKDKTGTTSPRYTEEEIAQIALEKELLASRKKARQNGPVVVEVPATEQPTKKGKKSR